LSTRSRIAETVSVTDRSQYQKAASNWMASRCSSQALRGRLPCSFKNVSVTSLRLLPGRYANDNPSIAAS